MYEVITITNKRVLTEKFTNKKTASSLFRVAKYGFPKGEHVEKVYLTYKNIIIIEQQFTNANSMPCFK